LQCIYNVSLRMFNLYKVVISWFSIILVLKPRHWPFPVLLILMRPKKKCVCLLSKKSRVGRSGLLIFFLLSAKPEIVVPGSGIRFRYFVFEISGKMTNYAVFFYLLCSQFRQKASSWLNKTLLLVKQQKWLSEFCVKIHRVASKN
jgi:hypothetical protein